MDAFETVIASILQRRGFWTMTSVKVNLTKEEKRAIDRHSSPRWELDVVAYSGATNEIQVVECKSFLDSPGVAVRAFDGSDPAAEKRYKLFANATLRRVVLARLKKELVASGFVAKRPKVTLCLAAGRIQGDQDWLRRHFDWKGWILYDPDFIRDELRTLRDSGYENTVAAVVTKLLVRDAKGRKAKPAIDAEV